MSRISRIKFGGRQRSETDKVTGDITSYTWDAEDQHIQIDRPDGTVVTYAYDVLGRRVAGTLCQRQSSWLGS